MKLLILFLFILGNHLNGDIACLYDGRICPHDVALQKWTEGYTEEMSSHLWELHLRGPRGLSEAKLFNVSSVPLKRLLHLDLGREEFSHRELVQSLWSDRQIFRSISGLRILDALQTQYGEHPFTHNSPISLDVIVKGLRVVWDGAHIIINQRPQSEPWAFLEVGQPIISLDQAQLPDGMVRREGVVLDLEDLYQQIYKFEMRADSAFLILPDHRNLSKWHPLRALLEPNSPKLAVDNSLIIKIKEDLAGYLSGHKQALVSLRSHLEQIYLSLANRPLLGDLRTPSSAQLQAESLYSRLPLLQWIIGLYLVGSILTLTKRGNLFGTLMTYSAFLLHSTLIALRIYILMRPPVANMLETYLYVPWIVMVFAFILHGIYRTPYLLACSGMLSSALLLTAQLQFPGLPLELVPAVLNSQFWLTCHVLLVVASYGIFALLAALGHLYLATYIYATVTRSPLPFWLSQIGALMHLLLYVGTGALISGTLLGGVWAAQSWGRFWDWDPKESWAFVSCCIYLLIIHSVAFRKINLRHFSLAVIVGFVVISFTWYGVNYILGTGFHSYGFGKGSPLPYLLFVGTEIAFCLGMIIIHSLYKDKSGVVAR